MNAPSRFLPAVIAVLGAAWMAGGSLDRGDEQASGIRAFGQLPVVYEGRVKPYDTLARNSLVVLSDRQTWRDDAGRKRPAIEWLLDVMSGSPRAADHAVFRIHNPQLLTQLGLDRRKGYRYAYNEFADRLGEIEAQAVAASRLDAEQRDVYDLKVLEFWQRVMRYTVLIQAHALPGIDDNPHAGLNEAIRRLEMLQAFSLPHTVPPRDSGEEWKPLLQAVIDDAITPEPNPAVRALAGVLSAWRSGDPDAFDAQVSAFAAHLALVMPQEERVLGFEALFNRVAPFYRCAVLYLVAFSLGIFAWLGRPDVFRRAAFWLLGVTFAAHTLAIAARVYISGYPPITNLYGTAVFIGWGCVLLGLILESIYRIGIGTVLAATVGFITLLIAHFLSGDGETLEMMQAVLDTKFWLATHVVVINFGYSATFLAAGLSGMYILRGVLTRSLDADTERVFSRMIYGILCFALLLSFVGTVLGGLWADDSWGRFWGWDPKENGALMIVLWNALILHARWGGLVRTRGIAVLSVFGGVITAWSWFGVNQLGVGLHSYGFTDSVTFWLVVFVASQLAVMVIGLLPRRLWRSKESASQKL